MANLIPQTQYNHIAYKVLTNTAIKLVVFFFFLIFLGPHLWHTEVPSLGVESDLKLLAYATTTSMSDLSKFVTYDSARSNTGSLTHRARPGIKPTSSQIFQGYKVFE